VSSFSIRTARDFLAKLVDERNDFKNSIELSARHAINASMTAYHLHEWVWKEFVKRRRDLHQQWGLRNFQGKPNQRFFQYLVTQCPALDTAEKITNGTKHFDPSKIVTGEHEGAFSRDFSRDLDVSYLWIEREDLKAPQEPHAPQQDAEDFLDELVTFWETFFLKYGW
jgi:hypothetical protein